MYFAALWNQQGFALVGVGVGVLLVGGTNGVGGAAAANSAGVLGPLGVLLLGPLERGRVFLLFCTSIAGAAGASVFNG